MWDCQKVTICHPNYLVSSKQSQYQLALYGMDKLYMFMQTLWTCTLRQLYQFLTTFITISWILGICQNIYNIYIYEEQAEHFHLMTGEVVILLVDVIPPPLQCTMMKPEKMEKKWEIKNFVENTCRKKLTRHKRAVLVIKKIHLLSKVTDHLCTLFFPLEMFTLLRFLSTVC